MLVSRSFQLSYTECSSFTTPCFIESSFSSSCLLNKELTVRNAHVLPIGNIANVTMKQLVSYQCSSLDSILHHCTSGAATFTSFCWWYTMSSIPSCRLESVSHKFDWAYSSLLVESSYVPVVTRRVLISTDGESLLCRSLSVTVTEPLLDSAHRANTPPFIYSKYYSLTYSSTLVMLLKYLNFDLAPFSQTSIHRLEVCESSQQFVCAQRWLLKSNIV